MASEEIALVLSHRSDNNNNNHPQFLFQDHHHSTTTTLPFHRNNPPNHHHNSGHHHHPNNNNKTTRELTGFIEHQNRHFHHHHHHHQPQSTTDDFRQAAPAYHHRGGGIQYSSPSGGGSDSDEDGDGDDEDDEIDDGDGDVVGIVNSSDDVKNGHKSNVSGHSSCEKNENGKRTHLSSIGSSSEVMKEGMLNHQQTRLCQYQQNAITVADPNGELYYSQYLRGVEGSGAGIKDMLVENGCGFSGRKDVSSSGGSGESLRVILSDPLTGALMDDAMILPCGHSFGSGGMQHIMRMKACYTCSHPVSEGSVAPNLSLRSAVLAFRREEELQTHRVSKRRNRLEQDKSNYGDSTLLDQSKGRGVQFPFFVTDRVIIKGNKRTPPRFVGREAVVTTQCLNGWYVVKTLDNAESVKLQYRSLAKVEDARPLDLGSSKITPPNWL